MLHPLDVFAGGDYLSAARHLTPDTWQYWASFGLMGHPADAAGALQRFAEPDAAFYSGVASWIAGDDDRALRVLDRCESDHARRLLALIRRRPITVLAQLPWNRCGSWDILTHLSDPAFRLLNISFHPDDIQNQPYADIAALVPSGVQPDLFVAEMLEWHLIAPNVRALRCPIIGHSSDFDLHIQAVAPWLELFDELIVLDSVEWRDMSRIARAPVSVFPKVFGVPSQLPDLAERERDIDVFLSGTVTHPYHFDKDTIVLEALSVPDIRLRMINGFDGLESYYRNLSRSKLCCTYVRHPGAMPTRGLEALGMGCAVAVQEESALRLFADEAAGVVPYGPETRSLRAAIQTVLARWDEYRTQARAGSEMIRREFALERVASQYFRFLTVLAARPRVPRPGPDPDQLVQKRAVVQKGWLPSYNFGKGLLMEWAAESEARIERELQTEESPRLLNDLARERLLAHYHDEADSEADWLDDADSEADWLDDVVAPLERAIDRFPDSLVPRFNLIRALLHFGGPARVRRGVSLIDDALQCSPDEWHVDPLDDVLPWDFCPSLFNYRRYFDTVTRSLASAATAAPGLIPVILASLNYYRAKYAYEIPGYRSDIQWAAEAVRLDPDFAEYVLYYSSSLINRGRSDDVVEACAQLRRTSRQSVRLLEILDIARQLPTDMQGDWYKDLERLAARFWSATEMRENVLEPLLRSSVDVPAGRVGVA